MTLTAMDVDADAAPDKSRLTELCTEFVETIVPSRHVNDAASRLVRLFMAVLNGVKGRSVAGKSGVARVHVENPAKYEFEGCFPTYFEGTFNLGPQFRLVAPFVSATFRIYFDTYLAYKGDKKKSNDMCKRDFAHVLELVVSKVGMEQLKADDADTADSDTESDSGAMPSKLKNLEDLLKRCNFAVTDDDDDAVIVYREPEYTENDDGEPRRGLSTSDIKKHLYDALKPSVNSLDRAFVVSKVVWMEGDVQKAVRDDVKWRIHNIFGAYKAVCRARLGAGDMKDDAVEEAVDADDGMDTGDGATPGPSPAKRKSDKFDKKERKEKKKARREAKEAKEAKEQTKKDLALTGLAVAKSMGDAMRAALANPRNEFTETLVEVDPDAETRAEVDPDAETRAEVDPDAETLVEVDSDAETPVEVDSDAETRADVDPDAETRADVDPDAETRVEVDPDAETRVEVDPDAEEVDEQRRDMEDSDADDDGSAKTAKPDSADNDDDDDDDIVVRRLKFSEDGDEEDDEDAEDVLPVMRSGAVEKDDPTSGDDAAADDDDDGDDGDNDDDDDDDDDDDEIEIGRNQRKRRVEESDSESGDDDE